MAMDNQVAERRKEIRYPVQAQVIVTKNDGRWFELSAVNISTSGMRLRLNPRFPFEMNEEITVEVALPENPDQTFSSWGIGKVVYLDSVGAGIQLCCGEFYGRQYREGAD